MNSYDSVTAESLQRILASMELGSQYHEFVLEFVECALSCQQEEYIESLAEECKEAGIQLRWFDISNQIVPDLRQTVLEQMANESTDALAVVITGLEASILLDSDEQHPSVLQVMNLGRELYAQSFPHSFTLFLSDSMLRKVQQVAPDFWSWRSAEPTRLAVTQTHLEREISKARSLGYPEGWSDAVHQVSVLERLLESYHGFHNAAFRRLDVELDVLSGLGSAYQFLGKHLKARRAYEAALAVARELTAPDRQAMLLNNLGVVFREMEDIDGAKRLFKEYLGLAAAREDSVGQAAAWNNLGLIALDQEQFEEAISTFYRALEASEKSENQRVRADALGNLGLAYQAQGDAEQAIRFHWQSLSVGREVGTQSNYQRDLVNLGSAYGASEQWTPEDRSILVIACHLAARRVSQDANDLDTEKMTLLKLAECAGHPLAPIDTESGRELLVRELQHLLGEIGFDPGATDGLVGSRTLWAMEQIDPDKVLLTGSHSPIVYYEQALSIARRMKDTEEEHTILSALAGVYQQEGNEASALSCYEDALSKARNLGNTTSELQCLIALMRLHGRGARHELARYRSEARQRLASLQQLRSSMLTAWLVDATGRVPDTLEQGSRYDLCLYLGTLAGATPPFSGAMAQTEFIYNLVSDTPKGIEEVRDTGLSKPTTLQTRVPTPATRASRQAAESREGVSAVEDDAQARTAIDSTQREVSSPLPSKAVEIGVHVVEESGFRCDAADATLISSWPHGSRLTVFPVTPVSTGRNRLDIQCESNGIPFDIMLSLDTVESLSPMSPALPPPRIVSRDGAEMVLIPAGEFEMGNEDGDGDEKPVHTVFVDAFYLDAHPVTNEQYRRFVEAKKYREPRYSDDKRFNAPNQPVVRVSWEDAVAYCEWAGKRLPTEAEWEKAARGGLTGRLYPWGNEEPDTSRANFGENVGQTTPVGQYPPNEYGLHDMVGNVWEWCADWYAQDYYAHSPKENPRGPESGQSRVLRGGSWGSYPVSLRVAYRIFCTPTYWNSDCGFRCAQDL